MPRKTRSLQTKLLFIVLVPLLIVSIITVTAVGIARKNILTEQFVQLKTNTLLLYADVIATPVWQLDRQSITEMIANLGDYPGLISVEILDETGEPLAHLHKQGEPGDAAIQITQGIYHADSAGDSLKIGEFHASFSDDDIQAVVNTEILILASLSLFIFLLQAVSLLVAFRVMLKKPLNKLVSAIQESESTGHSRYVSINSADELGVVADAYNRMQAALDAHAKRLEDIYNNSPGLLFSLDTECQFASVSDFFCMALDLRREDLIGKSITILTDKGTNEPFPQHALTALLQGVALEAVQLNVHSGEKRERRHFLVSSMPEFDSSNNFVGNFCVMTDITEQVRNQEVIKHQANYDMLTGLPNRKLMAESLQSAIKHNLDSDRILAILFLDLDRFKWVNDSFGHSIGDQLLRSVARRLNTCVRAPDLVTRFGGDEFVIIIGDLKSPEDIKGPLGRIFDAVSASFNISGESIYTSASIGVAFCPTDADDPEALLKYADSAMYEAKNDPQTSHLLYSQELDGTVKGRMHLASQVLSAAKDERLVVHYQPIVNLFTSEIVGYEALVRMIDSETGELHQPSEFIAIAEELGTIKEIGDWVLDDAVSLLANWPHATGLPEPSFVSVNVSYIQVFEPSFASRIERIIEERGVDRKALVLELTESGLIESTEKKNWLVNQLINVGCTLSIDDFGTGYSSLSRLKSIPFEILKIDREFVSGLEKRGDDHEFTQALVAIARVFGMRVIVEGIETRAQEKLIRELFTDQSQVFAQGYLYGEPAPIEVRSSDKDAAPLQ